MKIKIMKKARMIFAAFSVVVLILCNSPIMAQQKTDKNTDREGLITRIIYNERVAVKFDYFGELVLHPGLSFGIDYTLARKNWVTVHWDSDLGGYWHKWNNTALFAKTSVGTRFPVSFLFVDLNLGAGYMHSFPAGKIYQRSADGGVEKVPNWGHSHFMPTFSALLGWDGSRKANLPFSLHLGAETYLQSAVNHTFIPHAAAIVGFTYKFKK
jgi:hypothetical protein